MAANEREKERLDCAQLSRALLDTPRQIRDPTNVLGLRVKRMWKLPGLAGLSPDFFVVGRGSRSAERCAHRHFAYTGGAFSHTLRHSKGTEIHWLVAYSAT